MDADETGALHDWDFLHPQIQTPSNVPNDFLEIGVSEGIIRSDYFSSDPQQPHTPLVELQDEMGSVSSDNPSWIEPCTQSPRRKHSREFWSDSSSEGVGDYGKREIGEFGDSGGEEDKLQGAVEDDGEAVMGEKMVSSGEEKKGLVWWKLPLEILKFCLFKVNPGWSIAVAAAVMGIVILKRRLYTMKKKSRGVSLNLTVEDKSVSQFMKNAARLNEAFSVVMRVPVVRPLLPSAGISPWPILNMR